MQNRKILFKTSYHDSYRMQLLLNKQLENFKMQQF